MHGRQRHTEPTTSDRLQGDRRASAPSPRPPCPQWLRPAFTLVELLVVLGIIAILIGVLLPALSGARASARAVTCGSNIRQLVVSAIAYAQDNHGQYPPAHFDFLTTNNHRWHGTRASGSDPFDFTGSPLYPYLKLEAIKQCPDFEPSVKGFEASAGGYGYNAAYAGSSTGDNGFTTVSVNQPAKQSMLQRPSEKVLFADAAMAANGAGGPATIEYSFVEPPLGASGPSSPSMHFRHRNRTLNVAWADSHVSRESFEWTYPTPNIYGADNARANLGWFGPRDNSFFQRR